MGSATAHWGPAHRPSEAKGTLEKCGSVRGWTPAAPREAAAGGMGELFPVTACCVYRVLYYTVLLLLYTVCVVMHVLQDKRGSRYGSSKARTRAKGTLQTLSLPHDASYRTLSMSLIPANPDCCGQLRAAHRRRNQAAAAISSIRGIIIGAKLHHRMSRAEQCI